MKKDYREMSEELIMITTESILH